MKESACLHTDCIFFAAAPPLPKGAMSGRSIDLSLRAAGLGELCRTPSTKGRGRPGELMGGMARPCRHRAGRDRPHYQVPVEEQGPHGFGHVAARLPAGGQARALQAGIEAQDADGDRLEPAGDDLPWQLRQGVGTRNQRLVVVLPCPAAESVSGAFWGATIPSEEHP
jgi:hypothetical protein